MLTVVRSANYRVRQSICIRRRFHDDFLFLQYRSARRSLPNLRTTVQSWLFCPVLLRINFLDLPWSPLHTICEQWQKRNERTKSVETVNNVWRVIRHIRELSQKTFSRNAFTGVGGFLTKSKNFFCHILHFCYTFTKTGIYDE